MRNPIKLTCHWEQQLYISQQCVVSARSDSLCLATGVLLWRGGSSAGRLTQTFAAATAGIPAMAHMTNGVRLKVPVLTAN